MDGGTTYERVSKPPEEVKPNARVDSIRYKFMLLPLRKGDGMRKISRCVYHGY